VQKISKALSDYTPIDEEELSKEERNKTCKP